MALVGDEALSLAELVPCAINSALQDHENFPTYPHWPGTQSAVVFASITQQTPSLPLAPSQNKFHHVEKGSICQAVL